MDIDYDFKNFDFSIVKASELKENAVCLDTGRSFVTGVIDHHHIDLSRTEYKNLVSTLAMLQMLLDWTGDASSQPWPNANETRARIDYLRSQNFGLQILLHESPDLDSLMSAYVLSAYMQGTERYARVRKRLLEDPGVQLIVKYADRGIYTDASFRSIGNIYYVLEAIKDAENHRSEEGPKVKSVDRWLAWQKGFFRFLDEYVDDDAGRTLDDYCELFVTERNELSENITYIEEFFQKSVAMTPTFRIPFLAQEGGRFRIEARPALFFFMENKITPVFNIMKAMKRRPEDERIWIVYYRPGLNGGKNRHRFAVSVDGSLNWGLFGYGWHLERLERKFRKLALRRRRVQEFYPVRVGTDRAGYDGPDPWYDGRNQNYTIIDSPAKGTILPEVGIEDPGPGGKGFHERVHYGIGHPKTDHNIFAHLNIIHPRWPVSMVEAIADYFSRQFATGQMDENQIRQSAAVAAAIADFIKDPQIRKRLMEILSGTVILNSKFKDVFKEAGIDGFS